MRRSAPRKLPRDSVRWVRRIGPPLHFRAVGPSGHPPYGRRWFLRSPRRSAGNAKPCPRMCLCDRGCPRAAHGRDGPPASHTRGSSNAALDRRVAMRPARPLVATRREVGTSQGRSKLEPGAPPKQGTISSVAAPSVQQPRGTRTRPAAPAIRSCRQPKPTRPRHLPQRPPTCRPSQPRFLGKPPSLEPRCGLPRPAQPGRDLGARAGACSITRATAPGHLLAHTSDPIGKHHRGRTSASQSHPSSFQSATPTDR